MGSLYAKGCMLFCYLNSACGFLISYLFRWQLNSFAIPSVDNKWDSSEKSRACRNAGIMYLLVALYFTYRTSVMSREEEEAGTGRPLLTRLYSWDVDPSEDAAAPLLPRTSPAEPPHFASEVQSRADKKGQTSALYGT